MKKAPGPGGRERRRWEGGREHDDEEEEEEEEVGEARDGVIIPSQMKL